MSQETKRAPPLQTMAEDTPDTEVPLLETGAETTSSNGRSSKPAERLSTWLETPGTPQLLVAMLIIGSSCGLVAFAYDTILDWFLDLTWKVIPERVVAPIWESVGDDKWAASHAWVLGTYILFICSLYGFLVGASQKFLGCPGDLPETIGSFHKQGCVLYSQVRPRPRSLRSRTPIPDDTVFNCMVVLFTLIRRALKVLTAPGRACSRPCT